MGGQNYNHKLAVALADEAGTLRARMAQSVAALRCGAGQHETETDSATGDEICRWCGDVSDASVA